MKFEYMTVWQTDLHIRDGIISGNHVILNLNDLGAEGWELVAIDDGSWVFKRSVTPNPRWAL